MNILASVHTFMSEAGLPHPHRPTVDHLQHRTKHLEDKLKNFMHSYNHLMHLIGVHGVERLQTTMPEVYTACWAAVLDSLSSLTYASVGTAISLGLDFESALHEVHDAHMRKIIYTQCPKCDDIEEKRDAPCPACAGRGEIRSVILDYNGNVARPKGWTPPNFSAIIRRQLSAE